MKRALLFLLMLFFVGHLPSQAQDDPWVAIKSLLDQAETALDDGDLIAAQGLMNDTALLLSDEVIAACDGGLGARVLLEQAATATDVPTAQTLLSSARTLLADCTADTPTPDDGPDVSNQEPVTSNTDWTPVIEEFDGYEMAYVPAGCFMMGSDDVFYDERPVHEVCFDEGFWIDVYEVTNAQFGGPSTNSVCLGFSSSNNQPRNCVDWYDAQAFCEGRGGSLPSEAQWEYAARGPSGWVYPWGDDFVGENVVYRRNNNGQTAVVGSRPGGVSWVGAYDMAGNVLEWTTTIYDNFDDTNEFPYPYVAGDGREDLARTDVLRTVRGGSFIITVGGLRGADRNRYPPDNHDYNFGFRCVRSDEAGLEPVTSNTDWTPVIEEFDGVEMAYVPAGCFMMGSDDGGSDDERPVHEVCFEEAFWIDVYEVTNAQFGGPSTNSSCVDDSSEGNQPRNCVDWYEAQAFCEGRGGSLPSEAQWEYAARGPSGWVYPWGDAFVGENVIYEDSPEYGVIRTAPVGSRPGGVSWVGAYDMAGNVWEWTTTIYDNDEFTNEFPYPYVAGDGREDLNRTDVLRVLRGGSFINTMIGLRGAVRYWYNPGNDVGDIGFRCVRSS